MANQIQESKDRNSAGKLSSWLFIQTTLVESSDTVIEVLKACKIKFIQKSLQICYDELGNKYDLPMFIINEPESYATTKVETQAIEDKTIKVTLQYLNVLKPVDINLRSPVTDLKRTAVEVVKNAEGFDEAKDAVRLLYQGKMFKEDGKVGTFIRNDGIVQVFKILKKT